MSAMKQAFKEDDSRISTVCSDLSGIPEQPATMSRVTRDAVAEYKEILMMRPSCARLRKYQANAVYPDHRQPHCQSWPASWARTDAV
jgi:hypothetical protein